MYLFDLKSALGSQRLFPNSLAYFIDSLNLLLTLLIALDFNNFKDKNSFEEEILRLIKPYNLKLVCLAGYMKILSKRFIDEFPGKIFFLYLSHRIGILPLWCIATLPSISAYTKF